eukprot:CAMPEP_0118686544 /NCGR_PEP_ID=MMETSP0800-20121206/7871_1 /TAXON_ID=210618 ORGANISM="Striatella unipunctata, Strain CCMP2910" /NCGR_SAMPLE_ID=MMETSP0800 /ASSEMBLY_ACC=CAM_ASM_000638 /LENGTH=240 /DNA_ID=CAMNT_0006583599 /DNA_START=51 /DNA_END=774 /DNA_ORIENTATION=-
MKAPTDDFIFLPLRSMENYVLEAASNDPREALSRYGYWFNDDWHHLSAKGHAAVAHAIVKTLEGLHLDADEKIRRATLGNWGDGDSCISWYQNGNCPLSRSEGVEVKSIDAGKTKFALEFSSPATIIVTNTFDGVRALQLTYMTTGPAPTIYPVTRVIFPQSENIQPIEIDPTCYEDYGKPVHVTRTTRVAEIPPGETVLHFQPLETKERPFRLTGVSITSLEAPEEISASAMFVALNGG